MSLSQDDTWDAGNMSCGELVIHLRVRLQKMPGKVLKVIARDFAARADLPAFCKMTGNPLLHQELETDSYWIRAKQ